MVRVDTDIVYRR